jgi:hypothetical protein
MYHNARRRGRIAAALVASAALVGTAATVTTQPAATAAPSSAAPTEDCAVPADISTLARGDLVHGLTVSEGVTPAAFTGEILGVVKDGIAPGLDMVMADLDSPALQDAGGIWAGMSGSPVYDASGDLIGAVAYGLSWGPSSVAGITPFEDMQKYLPASGFAPKVHLSAAQAKSVASAAGISSARAGTFKQLRLPRSAVGLSEQRIAALKHGDAYTKFQENKYLVKKLASSGGGFAPQASAPEDVIAGGNLAATASYGDITFGGVGTATSVCNGGVVAFGHPFDFMGDTSLTLHPADAVYVQPESLGAPFKVANIGDPAGTIDGDHMAGISGFFGAIPDVATITSTVNYLDRTRTGSSAVSIPDANASVTFYEQLANHDSVLDAIVKGSSDVGWTVTGDDNGTPFELSSSDVYTSTYDIAYESVWELADLVWVLSDFPGVTITDVDATSDVNDNLDTLRVVGMQQKRGGELVDINRRHEAVVRSGGTLRLVVTLEDSVTGDLSTTRLSLSVPAKAGRNGYLYVEGGDWEYTPVWRADNVDELTKVLAKSAHNDEVVGTLSTYSRRSSTRSRATSEPTGMVVQGSARAEVRIK